MTELKYDALPPKDLEPVNPDAPFVIVQDAPDSYADANQQ